MKTFLLLITSLVVATNWATADEAPNLDDPKVREKILKEAVLRDTLEERGPEGAKLLYAPDRQTPYTGWSKLLYDNGKVKRLQLYKNGKAEGLATGRSENGKKRWVITYKDGKPEGLVTMWHDNGQKLTEAQFKNGKREGLVTAWDKDGKVTKKTRYKDGVEVKE